MARLLPSGVGYVPAVALLYAEPRTYDRCPISPRSFSRDRRLTWQVGVFNKLRFLLVQGAAKPGDDQQTSYGHVETAVLPRYD
jgi:hypothetical protein